MIFSQKTIRTTTIQKLGRFREELGKYRSKTLKMALTGQNIAIPKFYWHIEYDFLKEDHKNNFHTTTFKVQVS